MSRPFRIATISGHGAALSAALVTMTGRAAQDIEVVEVAELVERAPDPLPEFMVLPEPGNQGFPPATYGPQRTRKGKPVRW